VTLGRQLRRPDLPMVGARWCEAALPEGSVYRFLARERGRLFPPQLFADLFQPTGRRSVPPSILAVVLVLQRPRLPPQYWSTSAPGCEDRPTPDRIVRVTCQLARQVGLVGGATLRLLVNLRPPIQAPAWRPGQSRSAPT